MTDVNIFDISREAEKLTIYMSSNLENIDSVDEETRVFLEKHHLDAEIFSISLATREGLINAVEHGHQSDPAKQVTYSIQYLNSEIRIEIEDRGPGFDWRHMMTMEPNPELDHGRGIAIMKHYFSNLEYNEKGTKLVLSKWVLPEA